MRRQGAVRNTDAAVSPLYLVAGGVLFALLFFFVAALPGLLAGGAMG